MMAFLNILRKVQIALRFPGSAFVRQSPCELPEIVFDIRSLRAVMVVQRREPLQVRDRFRSSVARQLRTSKLAQGSDLPQIVPSPCMLSHRDSPL